MTHNKRSSLSICPLDSQPSQRLPKGNLKGIYGGFFCIFDDPGCSGLAPLEHPFLEELKRLTELLKDNN